LSQQVMIEALYQEIIGVLGKFDEALPLASVVGMRDGLIAAHFYAQDAAFFVLCMLGVIIFAGWTEWRRG